MWALAFSGYVFYRASCALLGIATNRSMNRVGLGVVAVFLVGLSMIITEPIMLLVVHASVPVVAFVVGGVLFIRRGDNHARLVGVFSLLLGVGFAFYIPLFAIESMQGLLLSMMGVLGFLFSVSLVVLIVHDVHEEQVVLRNTLAYKSYHDTLTGLKNRAFYEEHIARLDTADRWPMSLLLMDVNRLKQVNDRFGHRLGDKMLITVSNVIAQANKPHGLLVRYGGDEFIMLLPKTDGEEASRIKARIQEETVKHMFKGIPCSVAVGVACKTDASMSYEALFDEAERAMYDDKVNA